jgi:hypothetical protein
MSVEQTQIQSVTRSRSWQLRALSSVWVVAFSVAAFWMMLILAIHRNSPRTLVSFHGLLHAAIAGQFLGPASVSFPPENPFYAGEPVAYYWFFQYLAAQITRLFGLNIFYSLEALVLIATGGLMITAVFLGRKLYDSALTGILMGYLIVAGANPLGWIHLLRSIARGGRDVLNDRPSHLWGVVHPVYSLIRYNDIGGLYGPLLNFFLNITSRPAALASLLITVLCLKWSLDSRRPLAWAVLGSASAVTTALSPIIGMTAGGALFVSLTASWLWDHRSAQAAKADVKAGLKVTLFAGLAIVAGIVIAAPTYYHLLIGPSANHVQFWLFSMDGIRHVITVTSSIFLLVILAFVGLIKSRQGQRLFLGMLMLVACVLLGLNLAFSLPAGNASNLFHTAVVLLAVPAAGSILRADSIGKSSVASGRQAVGIFLVFLPTLLLVLAAYVNRPPLPASFQSQRIARLPVDSDLARMYQWVRNETDPKAIFVLDPSERTAMCGNAAEFPAITGRSIFTEDHRHYIAEPYPDSKLRFAMAVRFVQGEKPLDSDHTYVSKLGRPIYIVSDHSEGRAPMNSMQEIYGLPVFHAGTVSVYQWRN